MKRYVCTLVCFGVLATLATVAAFGQQSSTAGRLEVSPYVGGTLGFPGASVFSGVCAQGTTYCQQQYRLGKKSLVETGATVGYSVTKWLWVVGDYAYGLPDRETAHIPFSLTGYYPVDDTTTSYRRFWKAGGALQFTFPTVHRIVPYVSVGAESFHQYYSWSRTAIFTYPTFTLTTYGNRNSKQSLFTPQFSGGVRWYMGNSARNGIRLGVSGYYLSRGIEQEVPTSDPATNAFIYRRGFADVSIGVFHQFRK